ncbi:MAG: DUF1499 domain-containing protein [Kiloniellales bacterium]|nr:DUF1499 domain-containing protein [Kiloniellales bacterium]
MRTDPVDLQSLQRSGSPNDFLACPPEFCSARADIPGARFDLEGSKLLSIVRDVISSQPRTSIAAEDCEVGQIVAVQRSALLRFPDTVWLQIVPLDDESASLVLYSRSNQGLWDLGANGRRVRKWLSAIEAAARSTSSRSRRV